MAKAQSFLMLPFVFLFSFLISQISLAENYPATYQVDSIPLSTLSQFKDRIKKEHPYLKHQFSQSDSVEWQKQLHQGMVLNSEGIHNGAKYIQELKYIQLHKGLWFLVSVESKVCYKGIVFREEGLIKDWMCSKESETSFPLSGAFADLYILADDANIAQLSFAWQKNITPYKEEEVNPSQEEQIKTLGDIKHFITNRGGTWEQEETTWSGLKNNTEPEQPALLISVTGPLENGYTLYQSYLYIKNGDNLLLKTIDGKVCRFVERMNKDICEQEVTHQMPLTPFPVTLANSLEITISDELLKEQIKQKVAPQLYCGNLSRNIDMILQIHFERTTLASRDIEVYRDAFSKIPAVVDPFGILLNEKDKKLFTESNLSPFPNDYFLRPLIKEVAKGAEGDCSSVIVFLNKIEQIISEKQKAFAEIASLIRDNQLDSNLIEVEVNKLSAEQKQLWATILRSKSTASANKQDLDIASANLQRYIKTATQAFNNYEQLLTAAFAKQDVYSQLAEFNQELNIALNGLPQTEFFGLSVQTGISGNHYIASVHPQVTKQFNISTGDKLVQINEQEAQTLSPEELDQILKDTKTSIQLTTNGTAGQQTFELKAQAYDLMEMFYSTEIINEGYRNYLKINLNSFELGIGKSLYKTITQQMQEQSIDGFILNLQSNPGGNMQEAFNVISLFVKDRTTLYFHKGARRTNRATAVKAREDFFISDTLPLIVQTNNRTMSSSEIVASSLQGLGRSVTVGEKTFGKLIGQHYQAIKLSDGKDVALLVSAIEFFAPNGRSLNGIGIEPDVQLSIPQSPQFQDGNRPGVDYKLTDEQSVDLYPESLTSLSPQSLNAALDLSTKDIDQVSISLLESLVPAEELLAESSPQ